MARSVTCHRAASTSTWRVSSCLARACLVALVRPGRGGWSSCPEVRREQVPAESAVNERMPLTPSASRVMFYGVLVLALGAAVSYATSMPGSSHTGPLPAPSATTSELARELELHVATLAGSIGERNTG